MNTRNPLSNTDDNKLREVLQEIPQFRKKEELVHMYVAYEFPNEQGYLLKFWENALRHVMRKYFGQVSVSAHQLKDCFILDHFEPACFNQVLKELIHRRVFIPYEQLDTPETYRELGLRYHKEIPKKSTLQTITNIFNPINLFAKKTELPSLNTMRIVDLEILKRNMQQISKEFGMFFREKTIASEEELDGFLLNNMGLSKEDLNIYKELLANGGKLKTEVVEIGRKRYNIFIYNPNHIDITAEKTAFVLSSSIGYYVKKIEEMEEQIDQAHKEALRACQRKNKELAKQCLKRQKMFEETMKQYIDKKYICEENLLKIESSSSDKEIVSLLQYVKAAHDELKINPDEMFNIAANMREAAEERKETRMIIENMANENPEDVEDEYKQLERMIMAEDNQQQIKQPQNIFENLNSNKNQQKMQTENDSRMQQEEDENSMNIELLN